LERGAAGLGNPFRPPRNSLAGLVRRNRCMQGVRAGQCARQRFRQRCQARSDEPRNSLAGLVTDFPAPSWHCAAFIFAFFWSGRREGLVDPGRRASKLPRGPRRAESLRAGRSGAGRRATIPPTMPGSVRQSRHTCPDQHDPRGSAGIFLCVFFFGRRGKGEARHKKGSSGLSVHVHDVTNGFRARAQAVQSKGKLFPSCQGGVARRDGVVIPQMKSAQSDTVNCLQIEENPLPPAEYSPLAGGELKTEDTARPTKPSLHSAKQSRYSMGGN
jgi:hypothetical protein